MTDYCKYTPSARAIDDCRHLRAEAFDPDAFMRSSGDAVARYDTAWKTACVHKEPSDTVNQAVADFLLIGMAHLDALAMNRMHRTAMATMLSLLLSIDMAGADTAGLGLPYLELHRRYLIACIEFRAASTNDDFSRPHADALLAMEAKLYTGTFDSFTDEYQPSPALTATYEGLDRGAEEYTASHPALPGMIEADPAAPSQALVDMFSRLHALGMQD